jgi:hypothetical protein
METSREAFQAAADEAVGEDLRAASWLVYDHYEFREDGADVYAYAPSWYVGEVDPEFLPAYERHRDELERSHPDNPEFAREMAARSFRVYRDNNVKERYAPLNYPDIFLQFAGLTDDGPITRDVMDEWVRTIRRLGSTENGPRARRSAWWKCGEPLQFHQTRVRGKPRAEALRSRHQTRRRER